MNTRYGMCWPQFHVLHKSSDPPCDASEAPLEAPVVPKETGACRSQGLCSRPLAEPSQKPRLRPLLLWFRPFPQATPPFSGPPPPPRDLLLYTVRGCHDPLRGDDGAPTDVDALHMQANLPGPFARVSIRSPHDPALAARLHGDPAF